MKITILTIFPEMFTPLHESILGRAQKAGLIDMNLKALQIGYEL